MEKEKDEKEMLFFLLGKLRKNEIQVEDLKTQISVLRKQDKARVDKLKDHEKKIDKQNEEVEKQKSDLKEQKSDLIQYFGLFVAIFTAISIDIQLLKFAQNAWTVAGLIIMVNSAPLLFFWLIRSFLKKHSWKENVGFLVVISFLILLGGIFIHFGEKNNTSYWDKSKLPMHKSKSQ